MVLVITYSIVFCVVEIVNVLAQMLQILLVRDQTRNLRRRSCILRFPWNAVRLTIVRDVESLLAVNVLHLDGVVGLM